MERGFQFLDKELEQLFFPNVTEDFVLAVEKSLN